MASKIRKPIPTPAQAEKVSLLAHPALRFYVFIAAAWFLTSLPLLQRECLCLQQLEKFSEQAVTDQKYAIDGPIYILALAAKEAVPSEASIAFVNAATGSNREYYEKKLLYYLWPRKIRSVDPRETGANESWMDSNYYLVFASNREELDALGAVNEKLDHVVSLKKIFDYRVHGYFAIYRNDQKKKH
jgi:hypothetical protein